MLKAIITLHSVGSALILHSPNNPLQSESPLAAE